MATLNFPNTLGQPTDGSFTYTENDVIYSWNGTYWSANNATDLDNRYVNVTGDTMTGDLTVPNLESAGDIQSTSQNGGQLAGFRNQLINGDFRVWQRGDSWGNGSGYRTDHWEGSSSNNGPVAKVTNTLGGSCPNAFSWGGSVSTTLTQPIELAEVGNMAPFIPSSTWTLSFLHSGTVSSVSVSFNNGSGNFNGGEIIVNDVTPTSLGGNRYSLTFTIPSNQTIASSRTNLGVRFNKNTLDTIILTAVQLEPGPVPTPFEHRPIGAELALCQRYYEEYSAPSNATTIFRGIAMTPTAGAAGNLAKSSTLKFATPKRVSPTVTVYGYDVGSGFPANEVHRQDTTGGINAPVGSYDTSETGVDIVVTGCAPTVYYNILVFSYNADAEL